MQGRDDVSAEDGIGAGGVDSADAGGVDSGSMGAVDDHDRSGLGQHRLRPGWHGRTGAGRHKSGILMRSLGESTEKSVYFRVFH